MGVYIAGVEMPKAGQIIEIAEGITGTVYARISPSFDKWHHVTPVPPHGRLIDADALPWENQGFMLTDPDEWGLKAWDIEHAPTIIEAEEGET